MVVLLLGLKRVVFLELYVTEESKKKPGNSHYSLPYKTSHRK
jgi:hypothetical protein